MALFTNSETDYIYMFYNTIDHATSISISLASICLNRDNSHISLLERI